MRPFRVLAFLLLVAPSLLALEVPPPPNRWFTDRANVVSVTDAALLDKKLESFEQRSGAQFIIYVFPSLEGESIEDFTIRCVERWKVGQKKYDNGLVLFVFVQDKKIRIEVGYGLEGTITDAFSGQVIREVIAPHFQRGDYGAGLQAGADAIVAKIEKNEAPVPPLQQRGERVPQDSGSNDIGPFTVLIIIFVVFFILLPMFSRRRRSSGCSGCIFPLFLSGGNGITFGGGGGGFGGGGFGGGGGFSGGGGGFGGGGATGGW